MSVASLDAIRSVLLATFPAESPALSAVSLTFKVALWEKAGDASGLQGKNTTLQPLTLDLSLADLSTLPEGDPNRDEELAVLNALSRSATLFFDDLTSWTWSMASTAHNDNAENAVDFIRPNAKGAEVKVPIEGKVVLNRKDSYGNSTLVLQHEITIGSRLIYFYTKYLHMKCDDVGQVVVSNASGNFVPLAVGTVLSASSVCGYVDTVGQSTGDHLHEELLIGPDGRELHEPEYFTTHASDLRLLLTTGNKALGVQATAGHLEAGNFVKDGPRMDITWDPGLKQWVNVSNNLVYDRHEQQGQSGNGSYWLAKSGTDVGKMERVVWDIKRGAWIKANEADNPTKRWDPITQLFVAL